MSIKTKALTVIAAAFLTFAASGTAYSKDRGYHQHNSPNVIVSGHDRVMYAPIASRGQFYHKVHARQFNDRQYLRMKKHRKIKKKIRRLRRLHNTHHLERPIIIVTVPR